jgi:hypothetical protein
MLDCMDIATLYWLGCLVAVAYCASGCWLLQVVCYPTYALVGDKEFVPFHVDFGRRLLPVFAVPASLTCLALLATPFLRPAAVPAWAGYVLAALSLVVLLTTVLIEVPKHQKLDKDGKSQALLDGLIANNLPRVASWTVQLGVLTWAAVQLLSAAPASGAR